MKRFLVMDIGCLECGHETDVVGMYDTLEEARLANPEAKLRSEMDGETYSGDWNGFSAEVIYDLEAVVA